jgi:hypothetical protein
MSTTMGQTNLGGNQTRSGESQMSGGENRMTSAKHEEHKEGPLARTIEQQTAKLPSDTFLWAALGSIGASAVLRIMGKKHASLFVGDWVAPFLLFGVYNKIVKVQGSDRMDRGH